MKNIKDLISTDENVKIDENMNVDKLQNAGASSSVLNLFNSSYHSMHDSVSWDDLADILSRVYKDLKK